MSTTRRTLTVLAATIVGVGASALASAATADTPSHVSPRTAERLYATCITGAPTTPDAHERWVSMCRQRAAIGQS